MSGNNGGGRDPNNSNFRKYFNYAAMGLIGVAMYSMVSGIGSETETAPSDPQGGYSEAYNQYSSPDANSNPRAPRSNETIRLDSRFWDDADRSQISNVTITDTGRGFVVTGYHNREQKNFIFTTQDEDRLYASLEDNNISYIEELTAPPAQANNSNDSGGGFGLMGILSLAFMGFIVWNIINMRKGGGMGGGGPMGAVGGNKAKLLTQNTKKVTFSDVAGVEDAKKELQQVVEFLRNPMKYSRLGAKMPTGALLVGPPGTGKTLMARAVAGEAGVPFYSISGSDFVQMFVGVGASRVREMFKEARKNAPCIIFIDEIDAVGKKRGGGPTSGGNDEREQTLNQLLVEMDGFETDEGIVIMAATNRPEMLDDALLRPGRFDRQVTVGNPVLEGREQILKIHGKKVPLAQDVNFRKIAIGTPGFSGAMLANLVNEAAIMAAEDNENAVYMRHFEEAKDKVMMGAKSSYQIMSPEEKLKTSEHEVGHALVGIFADPPCDPLYKITAIPRGRSLGVTINIPEKDEVSIAMSKLKSRIAMMFGGRMAEELLYGKENITTGAENDIQQASNLARAMVMRWGFSDEVGRLRYVSEQSNPFGGGGGFGESTFSEETRKTIEVEVKKIIDEAEASARQILEDHADDLRKVSDYLNEREELSGEEVHYILEHGELPPMPEPEPIEDIIEDAEPDMPSVEELEERLVDLSDHEIKDDDDPEGQQEAANDNGDEFRDEGEKPWRNGDFPKIPRKPRGPV